MKFIFKSRSSSYESYSRRIIPTNRDYSALINVNFIESIKRYSRGDYTLKMVSGEYFTIEDSEDIKELESLLLEYGITSEQIEKLKSTGIR
ncbi:MAG: hypothetical protein EBE86_021310 [Hormoscilla sp. GUM202]|nr:hypothetical protein [Hormoscilla sp. GUM202]